MSASDSPSNLWQRTDSFVLPTDEVHVWRARLDQLQPLLEVFYGLLGIEEMDRASRFYFQKDRNRFIIAHGLLRTILGHYLRVEPKKLRLLYASYGKPYLDGKIGCDLRFNMAHSDGLALLAVTRGRELGVDIERIRPEVAKELIAEQFFSPREAATLRLLPAEQQVDAFFNCWTRKEAYIKARGEGLSLPLDIFDVSVAPGEPATLLETRIGDDEINRWRMVELAPGAGFKAALVVEQQDWKLQCWQWPEEPE